MDILFSLNILNPHNSRQELEIAHSESQFPTRKTQHTFAQFLEIPQKAGLLDKILKKI